MPTIYKFTQGTPEWSRYRSSHFNASDAAVIMGLSTYKTRDQLLREIATSVVEEVDGATQDRFDDGHKFEKIARPWAEEIAGDELYPVVMSLDVDGMPLSASMDGLTMTNIAWEHKTLNKNLTVDLDAGIIPSKYHPQMEQQLLISGATKCLFMASYGERKSMRYAWYLPDPTLRNQLLQNWKQFKIDLDAYKYEHEAIAATAAPIMALPAVSIQVNGSIALISNLPVFGERLKSFIDNLNMSPVDDQGFADAEAAVKTLEKAQKALEQAESAALAQTATIDEMRRTVALYVDLAKKTRLTLEKVVKSQKETVKVSLINEAWKKINEHLVTINKGLGGQYLTTHDADFGAIVKGLKTVTSIKSAINDELARAKIVINERAEKIRLNLRILEGVHDYKFLFSDLHVIIAKDTSDFELLVNDRVSKHKRTEAEKLERERARIREEEEIRARKVVDQEAAKKVEEAKKIPDKVYVEYDNDIAPTNPLPETPTADEIVKVLMQHYGVSCEIVISWLYIAAREMGWSPNINGRI